MTPNERTLLVMVAKDIRRLWSNNGKLGQVQIPGVSRKLSDARASQYDTLLFNVDRPYRLDSSFPQEEEAEKKGAG